MFNFDFISWLSSIFLVIRNIFIVFILNHFVTFAFLFPSLQVQERISNKETITFFLINLIKLINFLNNNLVAKLTCYPLLYSRVMNSGQKNLKIIWSFLINLFFLLTFFAILISFVYNYFKKNWIFLLALHGYF